MVNQVVPVLVDPNSAGADFWRRYHAFRRDRHAETRPDDPILPDASEERKLRRDFQFEIEYWYEVQRNEQMLSWFGASTDRPGSPGYESNRQFMRAYWAVHRNHRRQGIGSGWLPLVLELMDRHGCRVLSIGTDEESGQAFLRWLGAEVKSTGDENRLRIADVDWEMVRRWITEGQARSPQSKLEIYDGHLPEAMWADYAAQRSSLLNTMPWDEEEHGEIVATAANIREWYEHMDAAHEVHHTVLTREPDGVISGMTDVLWAPDLPTFVEQEFTGVRSDARGRGIGKWIKAVMLERIHRLYPHVQWITTGNAASNAPMLAINRKLGFRPYRTGSTFQISRDRLAERVRTANR